MIKGLIFDLDGTTLNTLEDLKTAVNLALDSKYQKASVDDIKLRIGNGFRVLMARSMTNASDVEIDEATARFKESYKTCYKEKTKPYDGIKEVLKTLNKQGILLGINSNKNDDFTKELIKLHFNDIDFVAVYGARELIPNKPDPYTANEIRTMMNLKENEVMYIGDSNTDIKTGINANLKTIGCVWGFRGEKELKETGATYLAYKPDDILKIVEQINHE